MLHGSEKQADIRDDASNYLYMHEREQHGLVFRIEKQNGGYLMRVAGPNHSRVLGYYLSVENYYDEDKRDEESVKCAVHKERRCAAILDIVRSFKGTLALKTISNKSNKYTPPGHWLSVPIWFPKDERNLQSVYVMAHGWHRWRSLFIFIDQ